MPKATGIGGVFIKAKNPGKTLQWYADNLGFEPNADVNCTSFLWRDLPKHDPGGYTVFGLFEPDTKYFDPSPAPFMINLCVDDLDGVLERLRKAGAKVEDKILDEMNGRFGYAYDPEGVKLELWEPNGVGPDGKPIHNA